MADSVRTQVRNSMLALVLAYLRDGVTTTDDFPDYPETQGVRTFVYDGEVWQIAAIEGGQLPLTPGLTLEFIFDRAGASRAMPQGWRVTVRFRIRLPRDWSGSTASELAEKIDTVLQDCGERAPIRDFTTTPITDTNRYIEWSTEDRGTWEDRGNDRMTDLVLEMTARYTTPGI